MASRRIDGLPSVDIPDPTDWVPTSLPGLHQVESALRCHVCKEFYTDPMITSCCHTFCSKCIRQCLRDDGICPICRQQDQDSKLRGNWTLREAVEAFQRSRAAILELAKPAGQTRESSPKRKATKLDEDMEVHPQSPKRTRMSTRRKKTTPTEAITLLEGEDDAPETDDGADEYNPDDGLFPCPICNKRMKDVYLWMHIGLSHGPNESRPSSTPQTNLSNMSSPAKPIPPALPALNYSMLKDVQLKKKLSELGISTYGNRSRLELRHKQWVLLWNSNRDSEHPKPKSELLKELRADEKIWDAADANKVRARQAAADSPSLGSSSGPTPPQSSLNTLNSDMWARANESSYNDLAAQARATLKKAKQKASDSTGLGEGAVDSGADVSSLSPGQATEEVDHPSRQAQSLVNGLPPPPLPVASHPHPQDAGMEDGRSFPFPQ